MPSFASRILPLVLALMRARRTFASVEAARAHIALVGARPRPHAPPRRMRADVTVSAGQHQGWPVYEVAPRGGDARGVVLYLHGGGWVNEIHPFHWRLVAQLAAEARTRVVVPIYPLVPHGTAGPVVEGVVAMLRDAIAREGADAVSVAGDSAGGQIALSAAIVLRDRHGLRLRRTVLISPALDLNMDNPEIDAVERIDPWLARPGIRHIVEHWRGPLSLDDARVSPLLADLRGLGPLVLFTSTRDITHPDTRLLAQRARAAGVEVDCEELAGLVHVYPLLPVSEGRAARAAIARSLRLS